MDLYRTALRRCLSLPANIASNSAAILVLETLHPHGTDTESKSNPTVVKTGGTGICMVESHPHPHGTDSELKVTCEASTVSWVDAKRKRLAELRGFKFDFVTHPFANLFFKFKSCTKSEQLWKVLLVLEQADFGILNCCTQKCSVAGVHRSKTCDGNCNRLFIHEMSIQMRPSWTEPAHRVSAEPHVKPRDFTEQQTSTWSTQMGVKQNSVTYQAANGMSSTVSEFGWAPADLSDDSVTWLWKLSRFANGSKLNFNRWTWHGWLRSLPQFGLSPKYIHNPPGSFQAQASWEFPPTENLQQLDWKMTVRLHTALFQRHGPFYSLAEGPTLGFDKLINLNFS